MTNQESIKAEIENLEEKMTRAQTSQDIWYIIDRLSKTLHNDADLGRYIRQIVKGKY